MLALGLDFSGEDLAWYLGDMTHSPSWPDLYFGLISRLERLGSSTSYTKVNNLNCYSSFHKTTGKELELFIFYCKMVFTPTQTLLFFFIMFSVSKSYFSILLNHSWVCKEYQMWDISNFLFLSTISTSKYARDSRNVKQTN